MMKCYLRKAVYGGTGQLLAVVLLAGVPAGLLSAGLAAHQAVEPRPPAPAPSRNVRPFQVEEATIADVHRAIQQGETTCQKIVQAYIERARAYNGPCTRLVTSDGASIPTVPGVVRAGSATSFPSSTTAVASVLPRFAEYVGPTLDFGRMEATSSDPTVYQQYGMLAGVRNAGQINALTTLNIRGERSVTCKAQCDAPPSSGPLAAGCSKACDSFRKQPDALEYAAALDAKYGRHPDLKAMPMYCVAFSFKDVYDTADMRSTGGGDVNFAMDVPPQDSTVVAELRAKGAIIYAKANLDEYNAGSGDPGGGAKADARGYGVGARSTWGGAACNPYDTARETGGSSSGSAASVAANLVQCSFCEETGGSCRQPAWRNDVVAFVTTKGLMPYGGAIGADPYLDRAGIHVSNRHRRGPRARRAERSQARLLRSPRHLYGVTEGADFATAVCVVCEHSRRPVGQAARRHARRHRSRIHGQARGERRGDERSGQRGDQEGAARSARRRARGIVRSAVSGRPVDSEHDLQLPAGARRDSAVPHARVPATAWQRRRASLCGDGLRCRQARLHGEGGRRPGAVVRQAEYPQREQGTHLRELRVQLRAVPAPPRRRAGERLGQPERERQILQRDTRRGDEELGEQDRPRVRQESPRTSRCARSCVS